MKLIYLLAIASFFAAAGAAAADAQPRKWNFRVELDGKAIGYHRYTLLDDKTGRELTSQARFEVKVLGFTAYRYSHDATERWAGNCLAALNARTDDDGERTAISAAREGDGVKVTGGAARQPLEGCVMTFAYWNPAILRQTHLLNSQTGAYEAVKVVRVGEETLTVKGTAVRAIRYRVTGPKHPLDLWYSAADEWLALESTVAGGRRLAYRLE